MGFHFDPVTGERIEDPEIEVQQAAEVTQPQASAPEPQITGYDPMTGVPIYAQSQAAEVTQPQASAPEPQITGYDPMTGAPIYAQPQITGYDPMTGAPVYAQPQAAEVTQPQASAPEPQITGYDPMTGAPIYAQSQAYDIPPYGGPGYGATPKRSIWSAKWFKIVLIAVIVLCVAGAGLVAAASVLYGRNGKFIRAMKKTVDPGKLMEVLAIDPYDDLTVSVDASYSDLSASAVFANDNSKEIFYAEGKINVNGDILEGTAMLDDTRLVISVPGILRHDIMYDYIDENKKGYIADDEIDMALQLINAGHGAKNESGEAYAAFKKGFNKLQFKKAAAKELIVNDLTGTRGKCKGYRAEVTSEALLAGAEAYREILAKKAENNDSYDDLLDDLDEAIEYLKEDYDDDYDDEDEKPYITMYLYGGRVAYFSIDEGEDPVVSVQFKGGDYWMENMDICIGSGHGQTEIRVTGNDRDHVETRKVRISGEEIFGYKYDYRNDSLKLGVLDDELEIEGSLKKTASGFTYSLADVSVSGKSYLSDLMENLQLSFTYKKGADIKKLNPSDADDLGAMSRDDVEDLLEDAEDNLEDYIRSIDIEDLLDDVIDDLEDELYYLF